MAASRVVAIRTDGQKQLVALDLCGGESFEAWKGVLDLPRFVEAEATLRHRRLPRRQCSQRGVNRLGSTSGPPTGAARFATDLETRHIPELLDRLLSIIGIEPWRKRLRTLRQQTRTNPLLREFLVDRYALELTMGHLLEERDKAGAFPISFSRPGYYRLFSFAAGVVQLHDQLNERAKKRIAGILRDGLNSEKGLAPFHHEIDTAIHLSCRGFDLECVDLTTGGGVDYIARRNGLELEVECKSISGDLGRQIHRRRMVELARHLYPVLKNIVGPFRGGYFVRVVLPSRLDGAPTHLDSVSKQVVAALTRGASVAASDPCSVEVKFFDLVGTPFGSASDSALPEGTIREFVAHRFGKGNPHLFVLYRPGERAVVIVVESRKPDRVLRGLMRELKESAKTQFTAERPGILVVQLLDLSAAELLELAHAQSTDPTEASGLQMATNEFFASPSRSHIHTLAYRSHGIVLHAKGTAGDRIDEVYQEQGPVYSFKNPNHPVASDPRYSIFSG